MEIVQGHLGKASVLIVDDSSFTSKKLTMMLKQKGYKVRSILYKELTLKSVIENTPDIILLKINLPSIDGYKVCEILKDDKRLKDIPILFIINENETFDKSRVFDCGGSDYITVPFNCCEVLSRIEIHLKTRIMEKRLKSLSKNVMEKTEQLEEVTDEIKEFNVVLEQEITERTKTEEALKESERQLRHSLELQKEAEEEKKKLNEMAEYDRIKTEFFSNISHELRTPINVIFSAVQIQELKLLNNAYHNKREDKCKYTNIMRQNCFRMLRLINNLIDITKIDSGYYDIIESNNNIISLAEDITLSVVNYVESKGLSLIFDTNIEEKIIACDPEKIERIIMNLLSNAIKFTHRGGTITVTMEDGIDNVCLIVKDTGRGIPENKLNVIFERFVQVDKSLARDHEGSGIGLSLVKALVELHGGTISVRSKVDYGTEFIIYLPCKLVGDSHVEKVTSDVIGETLIKKLNIEFSDIYK